ncbi:hypothetical protein SMQC17_10480 [Serratia marcescens]|nr:hypothetical protein SMQC17_10480 [Serratia marcescens]CAI1762099.1 Uncharacterised protein [Serratia marcescens]
MRHYLHMNIQIHKKQRPNFLHSVDKDEFFREKYIFPYQYKTHL